MKILLFGVGIVCLCSFSSMAQTNEDPPDSSASDVPESLWTRSWVISLTGNQADYQNWSRGGINSSAFTGSTNFRIRYEGPTFSNQTRVQMRFGQVFQQGSGLEKTEDMIRISNKTDYFLHDNNLSAYLEIAFRTQFAKGFDGGTGELISDFLSPGYFTESLGLSYRTGDTFQAQLGIGLKQTTVETDGLDQFYGLGEDEDVRSEGGMDFAMEFRHELFKNFTYEMELSTFSNLLISLRSTDVFMTNVFTGKINDFLTSTLELSFIYDDDFSNRIQMMRLISLGVRIEVM